MPDMHSKESLKGDYALDKNYSFIGSRVQGAFGEFLRVPAINLVPIGELSFDQAAFIEPITVCLHPILRLDNLLGKDVVVTGAGTIGLLAIQIFKSMGCREIIASDISDGKLELAKQMGATHVCNPIRNPSKRFANVSLKTGLMSFLNHLEQGLQKYQLYKLLGVEEPSYWWERRTLH